MGLSPRDVDEMTLAQWIAVAEAWAEAHDTESAKPEPMSSEEYYRLIERRG